MDKSSSNFVINFVVEEFDIANVVAERLREKFGYDCPLTPEEDDGEITLVGDIPALPDFYSAIFGEWTRLQARFFVSPIRTRKTIDITITTYLDTENIGQFSIDEFSLKLELKKEV